VDGLDDLLARAQALGERLTRAALAHRCHEAAHHAELDVGLEQGGADLGECLVEVGVGEPAPGAQAPGDALETVGKCIEH